MGFGLGLGCGLAFGLWLGMGEGLGLRLKLRLGLGLGLGLGNSSVIISLVSDYCKEIIRCCAIVLALVVRRCGNNYNLYKTNNYYKN